LYLLWRLEAGSHFNVKKNMASRRNFIETLGGFSAASLLGFTSQWLPEAAPLEAPRSKFPISANVYNWMTFYGRAGRDWFADLNASLAQYASTGIKAIEPGFDGPDDVRRYLPLLTKHGLSMPSAYVNSVLHEPDQAQRSVEQVLAIADLVKPFGTKIIVTNPTPIQWGGDEDKNDTQLITQAQHLNQLGAALRARGMVLAYHTHDSEMRAGAREIHHMLVGTDPRNVKFCFDLHWIFRGSHDSSVAVFDIIKLYGHRIAELHIRQSTNGVWNEVFGPGDIDYPRVAAELERLKVRPHLVLEQCIEDASPNTTDVVAAHRQGVAYLKSVFGGD
jgi:inosose dehydratase